MKVRPITIVAALAILALGTAGVVAWRHQDGVGVGQPEALPITLGGRASAVPAAAADLMQPAGPITYVAAPGLPLLDGSAHAWKVTGPAPTEAEVARLGHAFGVGGTPQHQGTGWTMIGTAQEGPALSVTAGPAASAWEWTVEASGSAAQPGVACAQPMIAPDHIGPGDSVVPSPCPTVPAPAGVPDQAAAEAKARTRLTQAGFDLTGWQVAATVDAWSADVTAVPVLDGTPVEGWSISVSFGGEGVVTGASGWFGTPTREDAYPLVGTKQAIVHLGKGDTFVGGIEPAVARAGSTVVSNAGSAGQGVAVTRPPDVPPPDVPPATITTTTLTNTTTTRALPCPANASCTGTISPPGSIGGGTTPGSTVTPPGPPVTAPGPTITFPPIVITIDRAELVLAATTGTDGSVWFVPAYRLSASRGGSWTVLAVDPSFVSAPSSTTTLVPKGAPGTTPATTPGSVEPGPAPAPTPSGPVTTIAPGTGSATTASTTIPSGG